MGCGGTKILAGVDDSGGDAPSKARKMSYMAAPAEGEGESSEGEVGDDVKKPGVDDMGLTNLEDINDKEVLRDDAAAMLREQGEGGGGGGGFDKDTDLDPTSAEAVLKGYKVKLKEEGKGTKRKKSTNKGLVMGNSGSSIVPFAPEAGGGGGGGGGGEVKEKGVAASNRALLTGVEKGWEEEGLNGGGSLAATTAAPGGGERLNDDDFDF
jgi:hypothetical protein